MYFEIKQKTAPWKEQRDGHEDEDGKYEILESVTN